MEDNLLNLRILRARTDDALEDLVRAHVQLEHKTKERRELSRVYTLMVNMYENMNKKGADFLIANQSKMEDLMNNIEMKSEVLERVKDEEDHALERCTETEAQLNAARKAEREFLEKILKNEIIA